MDEEPRNDDTEQRQIVVEYVSTITWNGINDDDRHALHAVWSFDFFSETLSDCKI
jgi:hypothetical protein